MIPFQREVADLFTAIRSDDQAGVIDQFRSIAAANQYRKLYALTARYVAPGSAVLDWGCGRGHFSYFLVKQGFRVTAYSIEHAPEIFSALSPTERTRLTFVGGATEEVQRLPFPAGQFAAAFSVGVLEHVRELGGDEVASLRELRRVVASNGIFVCYHLPNRYSYIEAASRALRHSAHLPAPDTSDASGFHRHRFTGQDIRSLCSEAGLSAVEIGRYGFLPRNSFNRLPKPLRQSRVLASVVNVSDLVLERLLSPIVQNYYFVARPRHDQVAGDGNQA